MSWCRTYKKPCRHNRSGTGFGPGDRSGQGTSNGSISAHKSSSTIHGRVVTRRERSNHHLGHARPGHLNKILLRAHRFALGPVNPMGNSQPNIALYAALAFSVPVTTT